jgi:tetratricopeptide (TPR) repeat protein
MPVKSKKYYAMAAGESEVATTAAGSATGGGARSQASSGARPHHQESSKSPEAVLSGATGGGQADILVQLGNAQFKTGEVDKAVASFDKALEINPNHVGALNMLEKIWKDELGFNPASVTAHANLGSVYQKKRLFEQALQQYSAAEHFADADPKTAFDVKKQIRLNIGTLFQAQKRYDLALKAYDTVLQVEPNHLTANVYKAALQEETGNTTGAMQTYDKILSIDPNNRNAQEKLLALIKGQGDPAKLADGLKQYADRFPNNATIQAQIGEEFHQRKDLANAAVYYQRALKLDPKLASVWANLGALYQAQGKAEESAEAFRKAQALDPANTTFKELAKNADSDRGEKLYADAVALQQQGKTQEALDAFRQALAISDTAEIRAAYGVALQSAGQLDAAIAEYRKAIAKAPKEADYAYSLGTAYHQKKDFANAESAYKSAITLKPGYAEAEQALAALRSEVSAAELELAIDAYNKQQYATALTRVDQALGKNPQDAMAHYYRGLILDGQKKPALAAQSYRTAIRHNPDFSDAYYALGVALDTTKDPNGARAAFEKFLMLSENAATPEKSVPENAAAAGAAGNAASPSGSQTEDDFVKYARERVKALAKQ